MTFFPLMILLLTTLRGSESCNEAVCASIVSKCTLLKSCDCDVRNTSDCSCCKKCYACLEHLYDECCSCVHLCTESISSFSISSSFSSSVLSHNSGMGSQFASLSSPDPSLFAALTNQGEDAQRRWTSFTYSIGSSEQEPANCTIAYLSQCRSMNKCKKSCESMGAASFRWFDDSCCECVGEQCLDYGVNLSKCIDCPDEENEEHVELSEEEIRFLESEYAEELIGNDELLAYDDTETAF